MSVEDTPHQDPTPVEDRLLRLLDVAEYDTSQVGATLRSMRPLFIEAAETIAALRGSVVSVAPPAPTSVDDLNLAQLVMFHDPAMLGLIGTGNEREVARHWAAVANAAAAITSAARAVVASEAPTEQL